MKMKKAYRTIVAYDTNSLTDGQDWWGLSYYTNSKDDKEGRGKADKAVTRKEKMHHRQCQQQQTQTAVVKTTVVVYHDHDHDDDASR